MTMAKREHPLGRGLVTEGRLPSGDESGSVAAETPGLRHYTPGRLPGESLPDPAESTDVQSVERLDSGNALTVLYIHGIANKPVASVLKCQWDTALFGARLGQRSRMAYWVNRQRYPIPLEASCRDGDFAEVSFDSPELNVAVQADDEEPLLSLPESARPHRETLQRIADRMQAEVEQAAGQAAIESLGYQAEVLPLPEPLRRWVTRRITRGFLPDVYDYLFDPQERARIDATVEQRLQAGSRFIIVAHSLGTVVAYHLLASLQRRATPPEVPLLVTLGSPLGMQEVQDELRRLLGGSLPRLDCVSRWLNVSDRLDPVAVDAKLSGEFHCAGPLEDIVGLNVNADSPRHPHSATGYLQHREVRKRIRDLVGTEFSEEVTNFTIARNVVDWIEDSPENIRHEVLIELNDSDGGDTQKAHQALNEQLQELLGEDFDRFVVPLQRFIAVQLTPLQIEELGTRLKRRRWGRIWQDAEKSALVTQSAATVHAPTAWRGYQALGQRIQWAILDTGVRPDHPHFLAENTTDKPHTIVSCWDCTGSFSRPMQNDTLDPGGVGIDRHGHGTHVAGVIAGRFPGLGRLPDEGEPSGMAPLARLHSYKVLDDNGKGRDSWIIKALQHIEEVNRQAGTLVIHGVNLSLGGDFDPEVYACGHSPLCKELRRLWRQGVVVVTSAGNLGSLTVEAGNRRVRLNLDLSIGDPANLAEAISVGSVHKTDARLYGVSYFSSRGPTADGRYKPDVVAPGERILSARAAFDPRAKLDLNDLSAYYVEMSGTSMAAPHVSGLLAAFLSQRRGYIGRPDELRQVLLENCTDIGRDRYHQGAGLPNLIKMLLSASS